MLPEADFNMKKDKNNKKLTEKQETQYSHQEDSEEKDANEKVMKMDVNVMEKKDVVFLTFLANYGSKAINKNEK